MPPPMLAQTFSPSLLHNTISKIDWCSCSCVQRTRVQTTSKEEKRCLIKEKFYQSILKSMLSTLTVMYLWQFWKKNSITLNFIQAICLGTFWHCTPSPTADINQKCKSQIIIDFLIRSPSETVLRVQASILNGIVFRRAKLEYWTAPLKSISTT